MVASQDPKAFPSDSGWLPGVHAGARGGWAWTGQPCIGAPDFCGFLLTLLPLALPTPASHPACSSLLLSICLLFPVAPALIPCTHFFCPTDQLAVVVGLG